MTATAAEDIRGTRISVEEACQLLVKASPEALEQSARVLERACASPLAEGGVRGACTSPEVLAEARRLQAALGRAAVLLEKARTYHARWSSWIAVLTGGYRAGGRPAEPGVHGRIYLRG